MARVTRVVQRIHDINPTARIILLGLYNPYRHSAIGSFLDRQVNAWDSLLIRRFAADPKVSVIRIADLFQFVDRLSPLDHYHPSADGYALIAQRIVASF
jgi:lysophospholipase L1-like esterase